MSRSLSARTASALVLLVTLALMITGSPLIEPAAASVNRAAPASDPTPHGDLQKPDSVSAMVTARASGQRVEDLSQTTETEQVFANPDGTWTAETAPAPVRVQDGQGAWHDIDTTLVAKDGGLVPTYAASDVVLSDGGDKTVVSMTENGKDVGWKWPDTLPKPVLDGSTATYRDVVPDGDLVVTALPTGFSHSIVLHSAPTEPLKITMPIATDGAKLAEASDGHLSVDTATGKDLISAPQPRMWDATADQVLGVKGDEGDPATDGAAGSDAAVTAPVEDTVPVDASVHQASTDAASLTLSPDQTFLNDPHTVYPVVIDPTWTSNTTGDTYVMNYDPTATAWTEENLRVGTGDGGTHLRRAFLHFRSTNWNGKHVLSAKLVLHNWNTSTCHGANITVSRITQDWKNDQISWNDQPPVATDYDKNFYPAYGISGCPTADATWDVTGLVQGWAAGKFGEYGVRLKAQTESNPDSYRGYASGNSNNVADHPTIEWTYNSYPATASTPQVAPAARYATGSSPSTAASYTSSATPTFSGKATDSDGGTVSLRFEAHTAASDTASVAASCTSGMVAQGSIATCTPGTALTPGSTYYLRAKGFDGTDWAGTSQTAAAGWSPWTKFVVASDVPAKPTITCPDYADGSWTTNTPASDVTCTISASGPGAGAPVRVHYSVNGAAEKVASITQSSDPAVANTSITVSKASGGYAISAYAENPSGLLGDAQSYKFGYGQLGMAAPAAPSIDPLPVTTGNLALDASGPPVSGSGTPAVKVQWRLASSGEDAATGWNDADPSSITGLTVTNDATAGVHVTGRWDTMTATHDAYTNPDGGTGGTDLDARKPVLLDVQVCVTYPSGDQCTWATNPRTIERVPHAFGDGFPVGDLGGGDAGEVALWTGEYATDATDVTVPGFTDDLSVSRTAASYAGAPNKTAGVFGPGWTAQMDGPDAGLAGMQLIDGTRTDGTLTLVGGDGTAMVFGSRPESRRTGSTIAPGTWLPVDEASILDGTIASVAVTGTGGSQHTTVTFTEADGTMTTFVAAVEPTTTDDAVFAPTEVNEPGDQGTTHFDYDNAGRVTRMSQAPTGISCPAAAPERGCRVLRLDYTPDDIPTVPVGEARGHVRGVWMDIWNPGKTGGAGMDSIQVAAYTYDDTGRLTSVTDPRSNLTTSYTYDGTSSRLASIAEPGLKPYQLEYAGVDHKLARVKRDRPADDPTGGTAILDTILYNVPVSGTGTGGGTGLPSLDADTVHAWGQTTPPTYAAAVFGPDKPVDTLDPSQVAPADWPYAELTYTDARGYETNTADNGAGRWQYTSTTYDDKGNVTRQLDEADINAITTGQIAAPDAGTTTVYNTDQRDGDGNIILPTGSVVTDTYGPVRQAVIADGSLAWVRPHEHIDYDQGTPNDDPVDPETGQAYALPTTETATADDPATGSSLQTLVVHKTGYDPIEPGDPSGWELGQATTETTVLGGGQPDIVKRTRYDALGRVIETRQPLSTGADAGTRRSSYYIATGTATDSNCDGRPEWAGLPCVTDYAAAPMANGAPSGPALPNTRVAGYSMLLLPSSSIETSGSVTRKTSSTYLADGRFDTQKLNVLGLAGSTPVPATKYLYDPASGLQTGTQSLDASGNPTGAQVTAGYDSWGRVISYSAAAGDTISTTYNAAGDVDQVADNQGVTTWDYNGSDANGNTEYRGLPTKLTVSNPNGPAVQFIGAYDGVGNLTTQTMPGGITQQIEIDTAGQPIGLTYAGDVNGQSDQPWLSWSQDNDALGRVRLEATPAGAAFDGDLTGGGAQGYSRVYSYDQASRLTNVIDNTAPAGAGGVGEPTLGAGSGVASTTCQTRTYEFDANGNRKGLTITGTNSDGSCASTGGITKTSDYDTADRMTGGYTYDSLGRATVIPGTDTPSGVDADNLTLGYYDDDSARTIAQNGTTTTYALDAEGRRSTSVAGPSGGATTETIERHYTDDSDNPGWAVTTTSAGSVTSRYTDGLDGNLAAILTGTGDAKLSLTNLHGDSVTSVALPNTGNADGIDAWTNGDEYGNPPASANVSTDGLKYGWLGGEERAATDSGLVLMGARLYNPATGQFTSMDPVFGGNSTAWTYPQDPVNSLDLEGFSLQEPGGSTVGGMPVSEELGEGGGGILGPERKAWDRLTKNQKKIVKSKNKRIKVETRKKHNYRRNPDRYDNKGHLKRAGDDMARRHRIIHGRLTHLETEIREAKKVIREIINSVL